jgi:hypothetical protein
LICIALSPNTDRQINAKPDDRRFLVAILASFFAGLPNNPRRFMGYYDRRFDFIAMLTARATSTGSLDAAFFK